MCESALELQLQQELAEVQGLATSLGGIDGRVDATAAALTRPAQATGVFQGGRMVLKQGSYSAEVSKYNLLAPSSSSVEEVEHKSIEPPEKDLVLQQRLASGAAAFRW